MDAATPSTEPGRKTASPSRRTGVPGDRLLSDPGYAALKAKVIEATGLHYYVDKDRQLGAHLERRMTAVCTRRCREYLELLNDPDTGESELDSLAIVLTIGETHYFRHREQFESVAGITVPELIQRKRGSRHLRVWCAGCSTGPEPYTLSILLETRFGHDLRGWRVEIVGTDINRRFLAQAEAGLYERWALRSMAEEEVKSYFVRQGARWRLRDVYRTPVRFLYHNLARHPFPSLIHNLSAFDLILCRNVLMYFSREKAREIVDGFRESLNASGWMVLGPSDLNVDNLDAFERVAGAGSLLYRKVTAEVTARAPAPLLAPARTGPVPVPRKMDTPRPPRTLAARAPDAAGPDLDRIRRLADQGAETAALDACRALLGSEPVNPPAQFLLALLLEQTGEPASAEQAFKRTLFLDRTFVLAHYRLGLHLQRRRASGAARYFRNTLRLLRDTADDTPIEHGDGLAAGDLRDMAAAQLELGSQS